MGEFFHGWRRKAGVVTLGLACAATGFWARSYTVYDFIQVDAGGRTHRITSCHGALGWTQWNEPSGLPKLVWLQRTDITPDMPSLFFERVFSGDSGGLAAHWQLAIPLAVLSAYLILWKPRKRASAPPTNCGEQQN